MKKITFAVGDLRMGGSMRVQSVIANNLNRKKFDITFFSMRKVESYFHVEPEIIFAKNAMTHSQFRSILIKTGIQKYILRQPVDMTVIPNPSMVKDLVDYVKENNIETVVLVEQWAVVAQELKEQLPDVKLISWLHFNVTMYKTFLYGKSYSRLVNSYKYSDLICVLTEEDKLTLNGMGLEKVRVMHNPLTIESHTEKANLKSNKISFVGRIDYHTKGLDYLLDIAEELDDNWSIQVAGKGLFFEEKRFAYEIKKRKLNKKIQWHGAKSGNDLKKHFQDSSIFISTSRFEGFPLVFAEAMSFGLPVIAMKNSGSAEVLNKGEYGVLVKQGDVAEFVVKLKQFQNSPDLKTKYGKLSKERSDMFSVEKIISIWEEILQ